MQRRDFLFHSGLVSSSFCLGSTNAFANAIANTVELENPRVSWNSDFSRLEAYSTSSNPSVLFYLENGVHISNNAGETVEISSKDIFDFPVNSSHSSDLVP